MLLLFKNIVYANSTDELNTKIEDILEREQYTTKYPQYAKYLQSVFELRRSWGLSFRQESGLRTRGHNTNNMAESQFLVMKESLLQTVKEYNINALFQKLSVDLEEHYINKLYSISSGSNDIFFHIDMLENF